MPKKTIHMNELHRIILEHMTEEKLCKMAAYYGWKIWGKYNLCKTYSIAQVPCQCLEGKLQKGLLKEAMVLYFPHWITPSDFLKVDDIKDYPTFMITGWEEKNVLPFLLSIYEDKEEELWMNQ
jgi:hypothetical protein